MTTPLKDPSRDGTGVENLISTMMLDHEQAGAVPMNRSQSCASLPSEKPTTSLMSRLWRSKSVNEELASAGHAIIIKQSHWKPTDVASKCADNKCRILFKPAIKKRNCAMCGKVFCFHCTNYRRRLSANAQPDPLGQFFSVCRVCFNYSDEFGGQRDRMREFQEIRRGRAARIKVGEQEEDKLSICQRRDTPTLRKLISGEAQRLVVGYEANAGMMKGLVGEMVIPDWQKSSTWVESKGASVCSNCGEGLNMMRRKYRCRIGGQVFCAKCVNDDLLLYFDDAGKVKWALNGKDGGPTKEPVKFRLLTICHKCSSVLHATLMDDLCAVPPPVFLDKLKSLHTNLSTMQSKIDASLPTYMHLVECMEMSDDSPSHVAERHPLRKLIKAQTDLSDAFSSLAVESQKLKQLKPSTRTQQKLLKCVMMGTYRFYSDSMFSFRNLKNHLAEIVPMETLGDIQATVSLQAIERVEVLIQQLVLEALALEGQFKFDCDFFGYIIDITNSMDKEFKDFVISRQEDWDEHHAFVMEFIEKEIKEHRRLIKINESVRKLKKPWVIHHLVVSQCSSIIHECYRDLQAKTIDREFKGVKLKLQTACLKLDEILVQLNTA